MNNKVDLLISKIDKWQSEMEMLRSILLQTPLTEEVKWGNPCYTLEGKNVALIHSFKNYCALLFFKGALLKYTSHLLIRQTENVHSHRQIRFTDIQQIADNANTLKTYILQAIEVEKSGLQVIQQDRTQPTLPSELQEKMIEEPSLKSKFESLTLGRQRAYIIYFASAKQSKTRTARIEKYIPKILKGKGLHD